MHMTQKYHQCRTDTWDRQWRDMLHKEPANQYFRVTSGTCYLEWPWDSKTPPISLPNDFHSLNLIVFPIRKDYNHRRPDKTLTSFQIRASSFTAHVTLVSKASHWHVKLNSTHSSACALLQRRSAKVGHMGAECFASALCFSSFSRLWEALHLRTSTPAICCACDPRTASVCISVSCWVSPLQTAQFTRFW